MFLYEDEIILSVDKINPEIDDELIELLNSKLK